MRKKRDLSRSNERLTHKLNSCIFYSEENRCWIHFQTIKEFEMATNILTALEILWLRDPDAESRNVKVEREKSLVQNILKPWIWLPLL